MQLELIKAPRVYPEKLAYRIAKRALDLAICLLSLPVSLPVFALCALAIRLDSPGPVLFLQERVGKGERRFRIYKFRTLNVNLNQDHCRRYMQAYVRGEIGKGTDEQPVYKPVHDHYITRVGRILRRTSLDELPQIINVLRGEMSIVGPRPNVVWEVDAYFPWHHERMEVLPGITGLAQVRGRSSIEFTSLVRYDIEYIEQQSLALDLKILWWTARSIVKGKDAR